MANDKWQDWISDGRLASAAWFLVFCTYVGFRFANIAAPELTNAFVTITGMWVGHLGLSQGRKQARVEEKVDRLDRDQTTNVERIERNAKSNANRIEKKVDDLQDIAVRHHPEETGAQDD